MPIANRRDIELQWNPERSGGTPRALGCVRGAVGVIITIRPAPPALLIAYRPMAGSRKCVQSHRSHRIHLNAWAAAPRRGVRIVRRLGRSREFVIAVTFLTVVVNLRVRGESLARLAADSTVLVAAAVQGRRRMQAKCHA